MPGTVAEALSHGKSSSAQCSAVATPHQCSQLRRRSESYNLCITTEVLLEFGAENAIWPLFFKGLAQLVDFLARAYAHSGFRHRGRPGKKPPGLNSRPPPWRIPRQWRTKKPGFMGMGESLRLRACRAESSAQRTLKAPPRYAAVAGPQPGSCQWPLPGTNMRRTN